MKVTQFDDLRKSFEVPHTCPICNRDMTSPKRQQEKMWKLYNKCFNCVIEEDTKRVINGTFREYENSKVWANQLAFLLDVKVSLEHMLANDVKKTLEFVNEDGTLERMKNEKYLQTKEFFESELIELNKEIEIVQNNLNQLKLEGAVNVHESYN